MPIASYAPVLLTAWCQQDLKRRLESSECPVGGGPSGYRRDHLRPSVSKWTPTSIASWDSVLLRTLVAASSAKAADLEYPVQFCTEVARSERFELLY